MKYSIIIVAYKAFDYLDRCLDSLFSTREDLDCEVIIVDNTPGERTLEEKLILGGADILCGDGKNHGFAEGCNIGASVAKGDFLVFLNPDTEVFPGWLDGMAKYFQEGQVGAVGPISDFVAGFQNMSVHLQPAETPAETAARAAEVLRGRGIETKMLIGFCLMMPRAVWDEVGGMDPGCFLGSDDLDLSWRLRLAGYELLIASDVFVYHAGHKSFEASPRREVMELNRKSEEHLRHKLHAYYQGKPPTAVELWGVDMMNTEAIRPLKLSVSMIVRDEWANLAQLLPHLGFADEIVIVDTNPEPGGEWVGQWMNQIALSGMDLARFIIVQRPWDEDFAAARNYGLGRCTGDYVLWLDADDRVPEHTAKLIRAAMDVPGPKTHARKAYFRFQVEDLDASGRPKSRFSQPRLFPRLPGITWEGRLHESIVPSAQRLHLEELPTDITIQHTGYADPALLATKAARNLRILSLEAPSPARHWNTGNVHGMVGKWEESILEYRKALEETWAEPLNPAFRDQLRYQVARALSNLDRVEDMAPYLDENTHPDALFLAGRLLERRGQRMEAIDCFRRYLDFTASKFFWPYDSDFPTLRPAAYAGMFLLMEDEFAERQQAFRTEYPALAGAAAE
jgi:GT2 family glycosyltransferase